jgi:HAD superfamily hydrolase (TIGR01509 family)
MTTAAELIANAKALLLDFDGPVTALMPPPLNAQAAAQAREALAGVDLPSEIRATTDHLAVLRFTVEHVPDRLSVVEHACTQAEVSCSEWSEPSPEIRGLLAGAGERAIPVAIVSNNSEEAVRTFLDRFEWARDVRTLACRTPGTVSRMKPDPYPVLTALRHVGADPKQCVFVGDSVSDVEAGHAAGVPVIGLAKTAMRGEELANAGAEAILERVVKERGRGRGHDHA